MTAPLNNAVEEDIWDLYCDERQQWRWRHSASDGTLIDESRLAFGFYLDCVENAKMHGYPVFEMPDV